jgi:hypothetical protein
MPTGRVTILETPPLPLLVPADVFDARGADGVAGFGWCASDRLEWRCAEDRWDDATPIDGSDPARMVFVMREVVEWLPRELACLHSFGLGLRDEWALAPYAIDDATDELFARRVRPRDVLWLAADNLNALYWGLHDWAHFHNHGPFEQRAYNELQCDACALAWIGANRARVGLGDARWTKLVEEVFRLASGRFDAEGIARDARGALDAARRAVEPVACARAGC